MVVNCCYCRGFRHQGNFYFVQFYLILSVVVIVMHECLALCLYCHYDAVLARTVCFA